MCALMVASSIICTLIWFITRDVGAVVIGFIASLPLAIVISLMWENFKSNL